MNSLKKIAAVSGIIFVIALAVTIILTPFAVSSGIDFYNALIDKAESTADEHWMETTLDSAVTDLTLSRSGYYGMIVVQESSDNQIHIRNQDIGFEHIQPNVSIRNDEATVNFEWVRDPKLTEENFMQAISSAFFNDYHRQTIIELPANVSFHFDEENMEDLYYNVELEYTGFANYEELQAKLDDWYAASQVQDFYYDYRQIVDQRLNEIDSLRYDVASSAECAYDVELFQRDSAQTYVNIKNLRSDLLKRSYNFRKEYGSQPLEELDAAYLEYTKLIEELCAAEKDYDLLTSQRVEAEEKLNNGLITEEAYMEVADSGFQQQVNLDLTIGTLRDKFYNYLREEIVPATSSPVFYEREDVIVAPSTVPPTEVTVTYPTENSAPPITETVNETAVSTATVPVTTVE